MVYPHRIDLQWSDWILMKHVSQGRGVCLLLRRVGRCTSKGYEDKRRCQIWVFCRFWWAADLSVCLCASSFSSIFCTLQQSQGDLASSIGPPQMRIQLKLHLPFKWVLVINNPQLSKAKTARYTLMTRFANGLFHARTIIWELFDRHWIKGSLHPYLLSIGLRSWRRSHHDRGKSSLQYLSETIPNQQFHRKVDVYLRVSTLTNAGQKLLQEESPNIMLKDPC